jgi:hypothetical protein
MASNQAVSVELPQPLYQWLERRAQKKKRTMEAEVVDVLAAAMPDADELPADLADALRPLALLDEPSLWQAARSHLAEEVAEQIERFHHKRLREGLTAAEAETLSTLVRQYEKSMLIRAEAAKLLKGRGRDVSGLLRSSKSTTSDNQTAPDSHT